MTSEQPENYNIEHNSGSASPSGDSAASPEHQPVIQPKTDVKPFGIEPADGPSKQSVNDLDVCPNCGATMRGAETLVCLRCGFDLKTMKQVETVTGVTTTPLEGEPPELLVKPGAGDYWLPGAMAAISGLILLVLYLSGSPGLFPPGEITVSSRFMALFQFIVLAGMWTACGIAALAFLAHLLGMKFGDLKLAAMRMLGIVITIRLASIISLPYQVLEWLTEAVLQAAGFAGLSMLLFKLKPRDVPTLLGSAVVLFLLLWIAAFGVVWATGTIHS